MRWIGFARGRSEKEDPVPAGDAAPGRLIDRSRQDLPADRGTRAGVPGARPAGRQAAASKGNRRRVAHMLNGDRRHIELAYALQFAMPATTPVVRYGEEIGMGKN